MKSNLRFVLGTALSAVIALGAFVGVASAADCNPLSTRTCIAPFPSNFWTNVDASSPTGLRADVTDDLIRPELLSALPVADGISPTGVFGGAIGFSAGAGATFEFDKAPNASSLPSDGGQAVLAFDLDTQSRVPVDAFISENTTNPFLVSEPSNVVQVFPRVRWEFGHRILVVVTKQLIVPGSNDPDFDTLRATRRGSSRAGAYLDQVHTALGQSGVNTSTVRNATIFTVRPRGDSVGRTQNLLNDTTGRSHAVRYVSISYDLLSTAIGGVVTGEVRVDNYRRKNGTGDVDFTGATRRDQWVPFRLTLPRVNSTKRARVVMYGHGLGGFKETDLLVTASNAAHGFATLSIDWPNHGIRSLTADGGNLLLSLNPSRLAQHAGMLNQAAMDMAGVHKAITTSLAKVDFLQRGWLLNPLGIGGDGRPDIDPAHVAIEGTSLGGVLGSNFAALTPKLDGIAFAVSGVGLSHILSKSLLWPMAFGFVMPHEATGTEHAVLLAALQQLVDPSDALNSFDYITNPRPGQNKKPFLLMLGQGDTIVPNASSVRMANLAGTPLVGQQLFSMPGVRRSSAPDPDGSGVRQYPPFTGPIDLPLITGASSHGIFMWPSAVSAQEAFLDQIARQP